MVSLTVILNLDKAFRHSFDTQPIFVGRLGGDDQWLVDLMNLTKYAKINNGYAYVLLATDTFSKYAWLLPLTASIGEGIYKKLRPKSTDN